MITDLIQRIIRRFTGILDSPVRPSSSDLKKKMRERGRRVEANTFDIRQQRQRIRKGPTDVVDGLIGDVSGQWKRDGE